MGAFLWEYTTDQPTEQPLPENRLLTLGEFENVHTTRKCSILSCCLAGCVKNECAERVYHRYDLIQKATMMLMMMLLTMMATTATASTLKHHFIVDVGYKSEKRLQTTYRTYCTIYTHGSREEYRLSERTPWERIRSARQREQQQCDCEARRAR